MPPNPAPNRPRALKDCAEGRRSKRNAERVSVGLRDIDKALGGGLARGAVHEVYVSKPADYGAAHGFTFALAIRAAGNKPVLISRQEFLDTDTGAISASGLAEFGLDPACVILVRARTAEGVLRAGEQAARCAALGAVVIALWGNWNSARLSDLTVSRRLALASGQSGVPVFMLRGGATPSPSAASTRWRIHARPSRALEANAPGFPVFEAVLLRQRGGAAGQTWCMEWNRDRKIFEERQWSLAPLSRPVVPVSRNRPAETRSEIKRLRRA